MKNPTEAHGKPIPGVVPSIPKPPVPCPA